MKITGQAGIKVMYHNFFHDVCRKCNIKGVYLYKAPDLEQSVSLPQTPRASEASEASQPEYRWFIKCLAKANGFIKQA